MPSWLNHGIIISIFFIVPFQILGILIVQSLGDGGYLQSFGFCVSNVHIHAMVHSMVPVLLSYAFAYWLELCTDEINDHSRLHDGAVQQVIQVHDEADHGTWLRVNVCPCTIGRHIYPKY